VPLEAEVALTFVTEAAFFKGRVAGVDAVDEAARRGKREVLVGMPDGRGIPDLGASIGATRARILSVSRVRFLEHEHKRVWIRYGPSWLTLQFAPMEAERCLATLAIHGALWLAQERHGCSCGNKPPVGPPRTAMRLTGAGGLSINSLPACRAGQYVDTPRPTSSFAVAEPKTPSPLSTRPSGCCVVCHSATATTCSSFCTLALQGISGGHSVLHAS